MNTTPTQLTQAEVNAALQGPPHRFIDVGHCSIATWSFGQGPDLVFVHGWPLHAATWRSFVPKLAEIFTCHLLDLPGIGQTKWNADTKFGIHSHTQAILKVIKALELESYALVAHDSGGTIARMVAAEDSERVRALVLSDTELPRHHLPAFEVAQKLAFVPGFEGLTRNLMRSKRLRKSKAGFGSCFVDTSLIEKEFSGWFIKPLLTSSKALTGQINFIRHVEWSVLDTLTEVHNRIQAPVLLVWGDRNRFFPLEGAKAMVDEFPAGCRLEVIANARLFSHEEHPEQFVAHVRTFLETTLLAS